MSVSTGGSNRLRCLQGFEHHVFLHHRPLPAAAVTPHATHAIMHGLELLQPFHEPGDWWSHLPSHIAFELMETGMPASIKLPQSLL